MTSCNCFDFLIELADDHFMIAEDKEKRLEAFGTNEFLAFLLENDFY